MVKEENSYPSGLDGDLGSSILSDAPNTWTTIAEDSALTLNEPLIDWPQNEWIPPSIADNLPVEKLTRTTLHESNHTNDPEGGSPSHDGKKKAE